MSLCDRSVNNNEVVVIKLDWGSNVHSTRSSSDSSNSWSSNNISSGKVAAKSGMTNFLATAGHTLVTGQKVGQDHALLFRYESYVSGASNLVCFPARLGHYGSYCCDVYWCFNLGKGERWTDAKLILLTLTCKPKVTATRENNWEWIIERKPRQIIPVVLSSHIFFVSIEWEN